MTEKQFDAIGYFKQLTEENNTCRLHNFVARHAADQIPCRECCSSFAQHPTS